MTMGAGPNHKPLSAIDTGEAKHPRKNKEEARVRWTAKLEGMIDGWKKEPKFRLTNGSANESQVLYTRRKGCSNSAKSSTSPTLCRLCRRAAEKRTEKGGMATFCTK